MIMNELLIREATASDIPDLCRLYFDFHQFHAHHLPEWLFSLGEYDDFDVAQLTEDIQRLLDDEEVAVFVAIVSGQCVGLAEVYLRQDEPITVRVARQYGYLQSLMVSDVVRGQQIGSQLVKAAEIWAKQREAIEMHVETWEFLDGPLLFYEKNGYKTVRRKLVRSL
jgi:GNAT superfamily N-acetyltransferase